jgi:hypothetical protein
MLIKGTTAPVSYKPCIVERVVLEGKFTSDDSIAYSNGQVTGSIWLKHRTLYGRDYDWFYDADFSAFKRIRLGAIVNIANTNGTSYVVSNDGMIIKENTSCNGVNQFANNNTGMYITASDSDTGWLESVNPNSDEVKAFMNGWKAVDYFTTTGRYCTWQSIIDNSFPSIAVQTTALATSTGTTATIASAVFSAGDSVGVFNSAGAKKGAYNVASVSGNTLTFTGSANVSSGDILVKNDSNIVSYCKKNVAPGYEGYQLHYKLQNPEPTTDINCHVHGDIPKFDVGDNYLYLDSGIVLDEVANYSVSTSDGGYNINYYGSISSLAKFGKVF